MALNPVADPSGGERYWAAGAGVAGVDGADVEVLLSVCADRDGVALPSSVASVVLDVDAQVLSQEGRLAAIAVVERVMAALTAKQAELITTVAVVERAEAGVEGVADPERELIAQALCVSPRSAQARVSQAWDLCHAGSGVWWALRAGRVGVPSARALLEATANLSPELVDVVAGQVWASGFGATPGSVRGRAQRLVAVVDPVGELTRHERAHAGRGVFTRAQGEGMASLWWLADAATIGQVREVIDQAARKRLEAASGEQAGEGDGIDAARSDALAALLLSEVVNEGLPLPPDTTGKPSSSAQRARRQRRRPVIAVHVSLPSLLGVTDEAAEVPGLGFMPAHRARALAADADWQMFVHSADGRLAAVGTRAYTPTAAMTALVVARDRTCQFPGCAQPAHRCDIDHVVAFNHRDPDSGGPTHVDNLQALCRRHHNLKTTGRWRIQRNPDGTSDWTGPRGQHTHLDHDPDPPW